MNLKKFKKETFSFFLFYGDNQAFKDELINLLTKERNVSKTIYYEQEILKNTNLFLKLFHLSLFLIMKNLLLLKKQLIKLKI